MSRSSLWSCVVAACLAGLQTLTLTGQEASTVNTETPKFLRYVEKSGQPKALEVAVVHYESDSVAGAEVDLVGAVHIGEAAYYQSLNELFDKYDVVLYELVAPEGTVIPKGGRPEGPQHPVGMLQESARSMLSLESQLAKVDYTKSHFVRADMTPAQMSDKMAERGDTPFTVALSALADVLRQQNLATRNGQAQPLLEENLDVTELLTNPVKLKQVLARQLAATGSLDQALGNTLNQILVKDRNQAAIKVLQQQLAAGKKRIAIFYGAAHLNDFHEHLVKDFGMHPVSTRWLVAWDLTKGGKSPLEEPLQLLDQFLRELE